MIPVPTYLENHQLVTEAYGYWPSFHDAEVRSILLDRNRVHSNGGANARIELVIHCFEMTGQVGADGFFGLGKHHLIHFEFCDVWDVALADFSYQNVIFGLRLELLPVGEDSAQRLKVTLEPCFGSCGEFTAAEGRILSVTPCDENGNPAVDSRMSEQKVLPTHGIGSPEPL